MKREDVSKQIPGITKEQLDWLMAEHGRDINAEKQRADTLKADLDNANARLKTAQDGLAAFQGVDVDDLKNQITTLQGKLAAQAEGFAFDSALDTAILGKKGRSVKAVRALLDLDALKASKDRNADIGKALEEAAKANPWAFGEDTGAATYSTGAEHGADPHGDAADPVEAAFKTLNPNIKL